LIYSVDVRFTVNVARIICAALLTETKMLHRVIRLSCTTAIFLAVSHPGVAANDNDPMAARAGVLAADAQVNCSHKPASAEPFDPPSTSSLPHHDRFIAAAHFKEDISPAAEVRIAWLGANFMRRYAVKTEDEANDVALQAYTLTRPSNDNDIIAALADRHETRLADLWCLLKFQASGQGGPLRADIVPNIFFMRDASGELGVVDVIWGGAGWEIGASVVGGPRQWPNGARVIAP
jgi:hypothetical protein